MRGRVKWAPQEEGAWGLVVERRPAQTVVVQAQELQGIDREQEGQDVVGEAANWG